MNNLADTAPAADPETPSHPSPPEQPEPAASLRTLRGVAHAPRLYKAPGFEVAFLRPELIGGGMDPFIQIDAFSLAEPVFKPHPHAGFNAVTYILPESPLGFINRDSLGTRNRIAPGALHWTAAGRGVLHEEIPETRGVAVLGLQIFINLPQAKKQMAPGFLHLDAEDVPAMEKNGCHIRVVAGRSNGLHSPLDTPTPGVHLIDVSMKPGAVFEQELPVSFNAFGWIFAGNASAISTSSMSSPGTATQTRVLETFDLFGYHLDGERLRLQAGEDGARVVLLAGPPLNEPMVAHGPFVMGSERELQQAFEDYQQGRMGHLSTSRYDQDRHPVVE